MHASGLSRIQLILSGIVALILTLGLGYVWGASGRFTIQKALEDARQQLDLAEARGAILDARVSLYNMNFGEASGRLEDSKVPLRRARERYQRLGQNGAASNISAALAHVEEAQRLAGRLDTAANSKAGEALEAIRVATEQ